MHCTMKVVVADLISHDLVLNHCNSIPRRVLMVPSNVSASQSRQVLLIWTSRSITSNSSQPNAETLYVSDLISLVF